MKHVILVFISLLTLQTALAQKVIIDAEKLKDIDAYFQSIEDNDRDIGAISIFQNGKEVYNRSFGQKNLPEKIDKPNELMYQIGSISKTITAIVLYQLVDENKIDLDEKLSDYYPEIEHSEKISLDQMLNHRSGIGRIIVKNDSIYDWLYKPVTDQEIIEVINKNGARFEPGEKQEYSNGGYFLLAKIVEDKLEKSYKQIVAERIFEPSGLKNTHSIEKNDNYTIALPYRKGDSWIEMDDFYFPNITGVGDIVSKPTELNQLSKALFAGKLLSEESLQHMLPAKGESFGHGLMVVPFYEHTSYGHGGDTMGTHSVMAYSKENDLGISYIVNGEDLDTNDMAIGLLNIIYDKKQTIETSAKENYIANPEDFKQYEGVYGAPGFPLDMTVTKVGDALQCQGTGQPSFFVKPTGKNTFEYEKARLKLEFIPSEDKLIVHQGQRIELTRKK